MIAVHQTTQQIYHYAVHDNAGEFKSNLFSLLNNKSHEACLEELNQHGAWHVSNHHTSIQKLLQSHTLEMIEQNILALLHPKAVLALKTVGLPLMPSIYNWLIQDKATFVRKRKALLDYPLFMIPALRGFTTDHISHTLDEAEEKLITTAIAHDGQLEPILCELYSIDMFSLTALKHLTSGMVNAESHPTLYPKISHLVDFCQFLSSWESKNDQYPIDS